MSKRVWLILGLVTLLILLAVGWFFFIRDTGPIPRKYKKGLDFSLYYPYRLPAGYSVDRTSFKREKDVLIFSINAPKERNVAVAQQATPVDAPPQSIKDSPAPKIGERLFPIGIGSVHIGLWGDKYVCDIVTEDSWIIMNVTGFTADEAAAIAKSFKKL